MSELTNVDFFQKDNSTIWLHDNLKEYRPYEKADKSTVQSKPYDSLESKPTSVQDSQRDFKAPITENSPTIIADSTPLQIWEGTVLEIKPKEGVMTALLNAKMGQVPRHTADINLQWVSEQDKELAQPGAIFYLTLYKRTKLGGSIENSQELRFRRRPSWSQMEINRIEENAGTLLSKMTALPTAE